MDANTLVDFVMKTYGDRSWNSEFVIRLGVELAQIVNKIVELKGSEKKILVVNVMLRSLELRRNLETKGLAEDSQEYIDLIDEFKLHAHIVTDVLPGTLDLIIAASRGEIPDLRKIKPKTWWRYVCWATTTMVDVLALRKVLPNFMVDKVKDVAKKIEDIGDSLLDSTAVKDVKVVEDEKTTVVENPMLTKE